MSGRAGYQPSPAADGAISLGHGLGGHAVPLQPRVTAGQKLFHKMVTGQSIKMYSELSILVFHIIAFWMLYLLGFFVFFAFCGL